MGRRKKYTRIEDYPEVAEMMVNCSKGDVGAIQAVGEFVEGVLKGKFGKVLEIYLKGKESQIVQRGKNDLLNAQFYLGMSAMAKELVLDLEQFVHDKDSLLAPKEEEPNELQEVA